MKNFNDQNDRAISAQLTCRLWADEVDHEFFELSIASSCQRFQMSVRSLLGDKSGEKKYRLPRWTSRSPYVMKGKPPFERYGWRSTKCAMSGHLKKATPKSLSLSWSSSKSGAKSRGSSRGGSRKKATCSSSLCLAGAKLSEANDVPSSQERPSCKEPHGRFKGNKLLKESQLV